MTWWACSLSLDFSYLITFHLIYATLHNVLSFYAHSSSLTPYPQSPPHSSFLFRLRSLSYPSSSPSPPLTLLFHLPSPFPSTRPTLYPSRAELEPHIRDCIKTYTSDYTVVTRRYQAHSSAVCVRDQQMERNRVILETPLQVNFLFDCI